MIFTLFLVSFVCLPPLLLFLLGFDWRFGTTARDRVPFEKQEETLVRFWTRRRGKSVERWEES